MELIDKEKLINEMNTRAEEEALDFRDIRNMVEFAPTVNAIPIPEGATNGDMFKAMFPNIEVKPHMAYGLNNGIKIRLYIDEFSVFDLWFPTRWWNAPYKKEVEE